MQYNFQIKMGYLSCSMLRFIIISSQLTYIWIASSSMMQKVNVTERRFVLSKKETSFRLFLSEVSVNKDSYQNHFISWFIKHAEQTLVM